MDEKVYELAKIMEKLTPELLTLGPIPISTTVFYQWLAMFVLFGLVFLATRNMQKKPKGAQTVLELLIGFMYSISDPAMGKDGRRFLPLFASLFLFILTMNLIWFIPNAMPPTTDLSTTAGLALGTIVIVNVIGAKNNGIGGHLKHFAEPSPALAPLNVVEELVKPISLSLRLFGNMFGEKVAVTILFILAPVFIPTPVMLLGVLMGCIQAFVFTLLTVTYLTQAVHGH